MYKGRYCWLCGRNGSTDPLDKHHIFGGAMRNKSERLGLYVYLCHERCHIFGRDAVHVNRDTMDELHQYGQRIAMAQQGWSREEFMMEFGKNYLSDEDLILKDEIRDDGFEVLDEEWCVNW